MSETTPAAEPVEIPPYEAPAPDASHVTSARHLPGGSVAIVVGGVEWIVPPDGGGDVRDLLDAYAAAGGEIEAADEVAAPAAVLPPISDRQFFQALALAPYAIITTQEALDAVKTGEIPSVMQAVIDTLPAEQQFAATMLVAGGTEYRRDNLLVAVFGASQGMDAAAIDAFWSFAGGL